MQSVIQIRTGVVERQLNGNAFIERIGYRIGRNMGIVKTSIDVLGDLIRTGDPFIGERNIWRAHVPRNRAKWVHDPRGVLISL
jgi:hypothetical protein